MSKPFIMYIIIATGVLFFFYLSFRESSVLPFTPEGSGMVKMTLGGTPIYVDVADTEEEIVRGLSGRESLGPQQGLLFRFPRPGYWEFWMKDMLFPIDIVWLDGNLRVIDIKHDAQPSSYPESFRPIAPASLVIEVNAGFTEIYGIKIGEAARFGF